MISIIIPAHNEENRLSHTLDDYLGYYANITDGSFEIIVVCNWCKDRTLQLAEEYATRTNKVRVINFPEKIGKGGAIKEGFKVSKGSLCLFVDADGSTSAQESSKLAFSLHQNGTDVAIGSRKADGSKIIIPPPLSRRLAAKGFNTLVRLLFNLSFRDTQCGAKAFKKNAATFVLENVQTNDFTFDLDLLWQLRNNGYHITEVPIIWEHRPGSTLTIHKDMPEMLRQVLKLRFGR